MPMSMVRPSRSLPSQPQGLGGVARLKTCGTIWLPRQQLLSELAEELRKMVNQLMADNYRRSSRSPPAAMTDKADLRSALAVFAAGATMPTRS